MKVTDIYSHTIRVKVTKIIRIKRELVLIVEIILNFKAKCQKLNKQEANMASKRSPGFRGINQRFFKVFYIILCKTYKPWGGAIFGPGVIIRTNLVEDH